jgi:nitrate reductase beta subunit
MWWANVETKPYGGYPKFWDMKILEKLEAANPEGQTWSGPVSEERGKPYGSFDGQTIFEAAQRTLTPDSARVLGYLPSDEDWNSPNIYEDNPVGQKGVRNKLSETGEQLPVHNTWFFYLARICNHCTYPGCLASCPRGSIYKRPEDGIVLVDQGRCRGYQECVKACPYKKVFYNPMTGTSEKCIACYPKMEQGLQPQCFVNCIGKIRMAGYVSTPDEAREDNPIDYLVHVRKLALPLFPQFGLEPNVYYIPPIHVPKQYLLQMFGPGVGNAIASYRTAKDDMDLAGLLALFGSSETVMTRWRREGGNVVGLGEDGREAVRVPIREPLRVIQGWDPRLQAARTNCP